LRVSGSAADLAALERFAAATPEVMAALQGDGGVVLVPDDGRGLAGTDPWREVSKRRRRRPPSEATLGWGRWCELAAPVPRRPRAGLDLVDPAASRVGLDGILELLVQG